MDKYAIYDDIKMRTNGDIYIGVVGPVRVGKSTFITQFMNKLVVPNITEKNAKERTIDELPQSADGKTIMTTQPHFVPNQAVQIKVGQTDMKVRMIDCVGYLVSGVLGAQEDDKPRYVKTPWSEQEMTFEQSAEIGTKKVIDEHSTVAIMVTTDGSVTDLERKDYVEAEERVVDSLKKSGKPFVIVLNCKNPSASDSKKLALSLGEKYGSPVLPVNALELKDGDVDKIVEALLMEFPVKSIKVGLPSWLQALEFSSDIISELAREVLALGQKLVKLSDATAETIAFEGSENFEPITISTINMGEGEVRINIIPKADLFYKVLSRQCGHEILDDFGLISYIKELAVAKQEYDKIKFALEEVEQTGYGIVEPKREDFVLGEPEVIKQGGRFGVKIKATAPSLHIIKVDVDTEVTPLIGTEEQGNEFAKNLQEQFEDNQDAIWDTNILGRSLSSLVSENINAKILTMPVEAQRKMKKTLGRIINEGKGGVICILL